MKPRAQKPRPKVATLAELRSGCRDAPAVWLALCDLSAERGSVLITPTRETLCTMTGIKRAKTVSKGLTALVNGGWIDRELIPVTVAGRQTARLLRITLKRALTGAPNSPAVKGAKRPLEKNAVKGAKRPYAKGRKTPFDFPTERGAPLSAGAERRPQTNDHAPYESESARIEREKMDAIRAAREAGETDQEAFLPC